ncbi:hypothetical protein [Pseudomonas synxantha]|uniref:Uncharacterized protein n=1 Tax=Pseudomonas synxantha TaxID=47883 RepID=A0AAX3IAQ3_9PSED|nr:hypothetical protein [Pseudomonas synxantha]AZE67172.1 hypothetical protein C4K01_2977 [Pseudomonas synxantha]AZE73024.1 hypothetical protein C4K00_2795 [Pseudomonas synxantha]AZE78675.1 hypothetical protein C4J99_2890 [Pseudomonas synxantha]MBI6563430.1 hypothetical protein [Pseudomonas synxantha]MBI6584144.1 hypothetical protein [Pseudomonas synxantha]
MQAPVDVQPDDLSREAIMEGRTEPKTAVRSNPHSCYEHLQVAKQAEITVGTERALPLCEKRL